jgi:hypothetical protein
VAGIAPPRIGWRLALATVALLSIAQLAGAPAAGAKRGLDTGVADARYHVRADQEALFNLTTQASPDMVRIVVDWRGSVKSRPAKPRDPSDPAYSFTGLDSAVREAEARGFRVVFTVVDAPDWAEGPNRPNVNVAPPGSWNPDRGAFGDFGHALAERYSGSFPDPAGGGPIPRVRHFEVWNEANIVSFLGPQWVGREPRAPTIYRQLLNAFYEGVHSVHGDNVVVGGGLGPYGDPRGGPRIRPLLFLRKLFCLKGRRKLKPKSCPPVKMDVLSHHPINTSGGPRRHAIHPDDASTADMGRVRRVLKAAEKGGNVQPRGRRPLWVSEYWWVSDPPGTNTARISVPLQKHARWLEEALYLFWKKRVQAAFWYLVRDTRGDTIPSGLFFEDGTSKPALQALRFPFVTERRSRNRLSGWGKAPVAGELDIQILTGGTWKTLKQLSVQAGEVFKTGLRLRGKAQLRATVGDEQSIVWRQKG